MKKLIKGAALLLALLLVLSMAPSAYAAVIVLEPNETTTFTIEYSDAWGVDGTIEFSDPSIVDSVEFDATESDMYGIAENGRLFFYTDQPEGASGKIVIHVTLAADAPAGASTNMELRYYVTPMNSNSPGPAQVVSTVLMNGLGESTETPTPTPTPTPSVDPVYTGSLVNQIKTAQALAGSHYTPASWSRMRSALDQALNALNSGNQTQVDNATISLRSAISALVPMDYSQLQSAIEGLATLEELEHVAPQWERFVLAVNTANDLIHNGGEQDAVNDAVAELLASKEELLLALSQLGEPVEVEVIVEKIVENTVYVEKEDESAAMYRMLFLIVLIISIVTYLVLAALVIGYFVKKRKSQQDTMPLVEYNIDEDDEFLR